MSRVTNKIKRNRMRKRKTRTVIARPASRVVSPKTVQRIEEVVPSDVCVLAKQWGNITVFHCGHRGREFFTHVLFGEKYDSNSGYKDKCGPCLLKEMKRVMGRCSLCGKPILPGSAFGHDRSFGSERRRVFPRGLFTCCRRGCCPPWGMVGTWGAQGGLNVPTTRTVKLSDGHKLIVMSG